MLTLHDKAVLTEYVKRFGSPQGEIPNVLDDLFGLQIEVVKDPSHKKVVVTSRRAGKSFLLVRYLTQQALNEPGSKCVYITDTRDHAKRLIWLELIGLNKQKNLGVEFNNSELTARFPNGSLIWLAGVPDEVSKERLRGHFFHLVCIDEAGSIPSHIMKPLMREIIGPALRDYDGTLLLTGTPNASCQGYFNEVDTNKELSFKQFHWTVLDNPKFPAWADKDDWQSLAKTALETWRIEECFGHNDPEFLREYKGIWARSEDDFILVVNDEINLIEPHQVPHHLGLDHIIGIDLGFQDEAAFVIVGYDQDKQECYHIDAFHNSQMGLQAIIDKANELIEQYTPEAVVVDPSSGGMHLVQELQMRYDFPCLAAEKEHKASFYRLLRADLRKGRTKLLRDSVLVEQAKALRWDKHFKREKEGIPCDLSDAFLYSWRFCWHFLHEPKAEPETIEDQMLREELEAIQEKRSDGDWY